MGRANTEVVVGVGLKDMEKKSLITISFSILINTNVNQDIESAVSLKYPDNNWSLEKPEGSLELT